MAGKLLAGVAKVDITPAVGFDWMSDFMILAPAQTVMGELKARALVFDDGQTQAALVTADLLWFTGEIVAAVRHYVEQMTGIPGAHVILNASHTHASAEVDVNYGASQEYITELGKKVAGAIYMAWQRREEVRIGAGLGACEIAISRWKQTEAACEWAPAPDSPVDHELGVLRVDRLDGTPLAILANYAAHPSMFNSPKFKAYSAEYPGYLCEALEAHYGPDTMALFMVGAGGDVKIKRDTADGPVFAVADAEETRDAGIALAEKALEVAEQITRSHGHDVRVESRWVELPLVAPFPAEQYEAEAEALRTNPEPARSDRYPLEWAEESARMVRAGEAPASLKVEVQLLRLGQDIAIFATPGELFNEVGQRLKQALGVTGPFVSAYSNDTSRVGYLPSRRVEGWGWCQLDNQLKYYTRPILPSNFSGQVEDVLVHAAREMMAKAGEAGA